MPLAQPRPLDGTLLATTRLQTALCTRLRELAEQRPRFDYRRLTILLRREGLFVNHKRVYHLYRQEALPVRRRTHKRVAFVQRLLLATPEQIEQEWSTDFTHRYACTWTEFPNTQRCRQL